MLRRLWTYSVAVLENGCKGTKKLMKLDAHPTVKIADTLGVASSPKAAVARVLQGMQE